MKTEMPYVVSCIKLGFIILITLQLFEHIGDTNNIEHNIKSHVFS